MKTYYLNRLNQLENQRNVFWRMHEDMCNFGDGKGAIETFDRIMAIDEEIKFIKEQLNNLSEG